MTKNQRFTEAYMAYSELIVRYIFGKTGILEDAVELCQEVFVAFYVNMDAVDDDVVKRWLLLTARNKCVDYYRKNSRQEAALSQWLGSVEIVQKDNLEVIVEKVVQEAFAFEILEALRQKNEKWYAVIEAVTIFGMSQEAAAEYLGISVEILRSRLYRARKFIRRKYEEKYREL